MSDSDISKYPGKPFITKNIPSMDTFAIFLQFKSVYVKLLISRSQFSGPLGPENLLRDSSGLG